MLLLASFATPVAAEELERVIAKVNGDIITLSELHARQIEAVQRNRIPAERIESFLRQNNLKILQEAIDDLLIVQRAEEIGRPIPPEYLNEIVDGIKKDNNIKSDADFEAALRREGMTLDDLKRNIKRSILRRQVLAHELESKIVVSDAEARGEYESRKATDFTEPPTAHLQEILLKGEGEETAALARELAARARAGEDFSSMARAHSVAPSRGAGGDLGRLVRREMNRDLEKAVASLESGQVSDPMPTKGGYRILKVVEKSEGKVVPFEEVKANLLQKLTEARRATEHDRYVEKLRKNASVVHMVREVPLPIEPAVPGAAPLDAGATEGGAPAGVAKPGISLPENPEITVSGGKVERAAPRGEPAAPPKEKEPRKE